MDNPHPKVCIVAAEFNVKIANAMIEAAQTELSAAEAVVTDVVRVPGSYEIPIAADVVLRKGNIDALVVLGFIERGETMHGEVMGHVVHRKIVDMQIQYGRPIGIGIIGPGATAEQAEKRKLDYARSAARAALRMYAVTKQLNET